MDWYLDGDAGDVSELRREISAYLQRHCAAGADLDGAGLVVSELVTNALLHAGGPFWVSIEWPDAHPVLWVRDLGPGFALEESVPQPNEPAGDRGEGLSVGGRGLFIAASIAKELRVGVRRGGGSEVSAVLPVTRADQVSHNPPRRTQGALPAVDEALPQGGFGKESFLRALVIQLAAAVEDSHGPRAAEAAVAQVGTDVGGQMEAEYRASKSITGQLSTAQIAECFVRLKGAIDGGFVVEDCTENRIVLVNDRCPFGDVVRKAPSLCRMTSSVFGGIASRNSDDGALVVLEERIALGDAGCRVVVWLDASHPNAPWGHRYPSPD